MSGISRPVLIGAGVVFASSFVLSFFGTILGGGVAGYLHEGDSSGSAKVGALAGVLGSIVSGILGLLVSLVTILGAGDLLGVVGILAFSLASLVLEAIIAGLLGALGGYVGERAS